MNLNRPQKLVCGDNTKSTAKETKAFSIMKFANDSPKLSYIELSYFIILLYA
ncbi:hypothetical protein LEP1GSC103_0163 [Leptospira borgpetersenii serovar Javanica str. UI 09931]|uniref:Uncharacterized protein n=3 Tax=Leptospira borgpetersenii TaxID=174 RepID=M3HQU9_LEPBO|nr:hypothetical protein LBBP_03456 [Leptospira borgpetersenii serovar Ballum]EMG00436.1 hypothetical protein LEP1GSC123_2390 [Leptospira borgpetersenii str. 200701203]EMK08998.1 hypothetical protein LEP1GSC066_0025 [Leptospira sp. serovar Kenya str. Sh9]EMN58125.1 hypothetical protein LEP1GSC090_3982 [Leptospira borgpetersenii serovar Javanica str. MK146]EMO09172.1 hypothetical protein LEP1GSC137_2807 [Leptospira borgpetersenii str. Noumea 25]EPG58746.1 hypothetical protein LEP1GSC103_0163 [Le